MNISELMLAVEEIRKTYGELPVYAAAQGMTLEFEVYGVSFGQAGDHMSIVPKGELPQRVILGLHLE
jgi:hypothetical protein